MPVGASAQLTHSRYAASVRMRSDGTGDGTGLELLAYRNNVHWRTWRFQPPRACSYPVEGSQDGMTNRCRSAKCNRADGRFDGEWQRTLRNSNNSSPAPSPAHASGVLTGISSALNRALLDQAKAQVESWLDAEITANKELRRTALVEDAPADVLAAGLPNPVIASVNLGPTLPASTRLSFAFTLYRSVQDRVLDSPALSLRRTLVSIDDAPVVLQFLPETAADQQVLQQLLPSHPNGEPYLPSELPAVLPGYLIHLRAQLLVGEEQVASADGFTLGQEVATALKIQKLTGGWHVAQNRATAGELSVVTLNPQGMGATILMKPETRTAISTLHEAGRAYWAHYDTYLDTLMELGVAGTARNPSFGLVSVSMNTMYRYGIPHQVRPAGAMMDVDAGLISAVSVDGDSRRTVSIIEQIGSFGSALEHRIPEDNLLPAARDAPGVSTVRAFEAAVASGQSLVVITPENATQLLATLPHSSEVLNDIRAATQVGYTATVSQPGTDWKLAGYGVRAHRSTHGQHRLSHQRWR